ncbi:hypothetical protein ACHAXR_011076 [Thalassiosira sp. AJA248-18]
MNRNSSPYHNAGWALNEHLEKGRGIKSIAFDGKKKGGAPDKATYATVCKTMQHLSIINEVLNANNKRLRDRIGFDSVRNKGLLYVMLYELLFGKYMKIRGGGKIKRMIVKYEKELRREVEDYVSKNGGVGGDATGAVIFPRYIRVNALHSNVSDMVDTLKKDLSSKMDEAQTNGAKEETRPSLIYADAHVPDLLVLPPTASSWLHYEYEPVKSGKIVLQDKSSCFSALVLAHGLGKCANEEGKVESCDYIDACSAPGNKTSHLAALVHSSIGDDDTTTKKKKKKGKANKPISTIFAFERSESRYKILDDRMKLLVPPPSDNGNKVAVVPIHGDFLKADPSDPQFASVRAIMLDPSCSGSGIVNSPDRWMEKNGGDDNAKDNKRIHSLSNFQLVALKHAMSFPNVDRIVYSTCSVHEEENEAVVSKALSEVSENWEGGDEWELMAPVCLDHWPRRGKEGGIGGLSKSQADCLVRCDGMDGDATNGFFVSFLVRKKLTNGSEKKARKEIDNAGIESYTGQFAAVCNKSTAAVFEVVPGKDDSADSSEHVQPTQSQKPAKKKMSPTEAKADVTPSTKAADKSVTKREKKLSWKRRQALQKNQRLKKKEDAAKQALQKNPKPKKKKKNDVSSGTAKDGE